jgi:hypothetical protein
MATTEERLAALEAKLAQLTATTPTEYYTHQYSGEEIDAAVGRAVTGGALDTSVGNVSKQLGTFVRPNLLDNSDFSVWQRYANGSYTGVPNGTYIADRYIITSADGSINSNLIKATSYGGIKNASGPNCRITQRLENAAQYNGMTLTLSVLKNTGLHAATQIANGWTDISDIFAFFSAATAWFNAGETLYAVKLELGDTQTLAHQDSAGKWVLNEVPEFGEQLRRCQRYFRRLQYGYGYDIIGAGFANANDYGRVVLALDVAMRTVPSITHAPNVAVISDGTLYNATLNAVRANTNTSDTTIELSIPGITNRAIIVLTTAENNAYIALSADL